MKFLCLLLFLAAFAQASLVSVVEAQTGFYPAPLSCSNTYTAPSSAPSFDRACFVPNVQSPARPAYAETAAQGPMHISLTSMGGVSAVGCTPTDGCPSGFAEIMYSDTWTVTGGSGDGVLVLTAASNLVRGNQYSAIEFQGGQWAPVFGLQVIPFVYGQPFAFSYAAQLGSYDLNYGEGHWSLDMSAAIETCTGPFPLGCTPAGGSVRSEFGDPFVATGPAPLVIIPEPSGAILTPLLLACTLFGMCCSGRFAR